MDIETLTSLSVTKTKAQKSYLYKNARSKRTHALIFIPMLCSFTLVAATIIVCGPSTAYALKSPTINTSRSRPPSSARECSHRLRDFSFLLSHSSHPRTSATTREHSHCLPRGLSFLLSCSSHSQSSASTAAQAAPGIDWPPDHRDT